ncbi:MAG TPA: apolipoprotein N-acyltransferase [Kiritimatiellia bacterium]|nr:apolipoprotein N-acyltransferase [Kiritimatiellia bacterium]
MDSSENKLGADWRRWVADAAAALSGALLSAGFAPLEASEAAWVALVPLLVACRFADSPRAAFRLGFLSGSVFWLTSIWWLSRVTYGGWLTLAFYCALYLGAFAVLAHLWLRRYEHERLGLNLGFMLFAACGWAGLEWMRSTFATGFAWNALGVTQYRNVALLQGAAWGGVYAVSALVVFVNAGVAVTVMRYIRRGGHWGRRPHFELMLAFLVLALAFFAGARRVRGLADGQVDLRVALVQPAIPQDDKWDTNTVDLIYSRLRQLTDGALRSGPLDLIIWPETALPDDVRYSQTSYDLVYELASRGVPLLVGSMDSEWPEDGRPVFHNSSFLFDPEGRPVEVYAKQHLVVFGEYVPLGDVLPFLNAMTPIQESFTAGTTATVFRLANPSVSFSVLICFEDTVARLARKAVRGGARLLVNQTNDAWFDPSSASRQHMAQCVLRVVETGVPAVRVANTGVSCVINRRGVVTARLEDEQGGTIFPGFKTAAVRPAPDDLPLTFYTRNGDLLPILAGVLALLAAGAVRRCT